MCKIIVASANNIWHTVFIGSVRNLVQTVDTQMKTSPDNLLIASRHSMGTVAIPSLGFAAFVRKIKAALGFIAHEASPLAVPAATPGHGMSEQACEPRRPFTAAM